MIVFKGTGCSLNARYVWTSEECNEGGISGYWTTSGVYDSTMQPLCRAQEKPKALRCCADYSVAAVAVDDATAPPTVATTTTPQPTPPLAPTASPTASPTSQPTPPLAPTESPTASPTPQPTPEPEELVDSIAVIESSFPEVLYETDRIIPMYV